MNKNRLIRSEEQKLACPFCRKTIKVNCNLSMLDAERKALFTNRPGDLTECPHCRVILEFQGDPLTIGQPTKDRVKRFNELTRAVKEPSLATLLEYVRRYKQMPSSGITV